jgi:hypothetical protein
MTYCPDQHHRRSIRLSGHDYSQNGVYFVTVGAVGAPLIQGTVRPPLLPPGYEHTRILDGVPEGWEKSPLVNYLCCKEDLTCL